MAPCRKTIGRPRQPPCPPAPERDHRDSTAHPHKRNQRDRGGSDWARTSARRRRVMTRNPLPTRIRVRQTAALCSYLSSSRTSFATPKSPERRARYSRSATDDKARNVEATERLLALVCAIVVHGARWVISRVAGLLREHRKSNSRSDHRYANAGRRDADNAQTLLA